MTPAERKLVERQAKADSHMCNVPKEIQCSDCPITNWAMTHEATGNCATDARTMLAAEKKRAPRKPKPNDDCLVVSYGKGHRALIGRTYMTPKHARRLASWLLRFALWSDAQKEKRQ